MPLLVLDFRSFRERSIVEDMRADVAQPFLLAARGVLEQELGGEVGRGQITVERGDFEAGEITAGGGGPGALSRAGVDWQSQGHRRAVRRAAGKQGSWRPAGLGG